MITEKQKCIAEQTIYGDLVTKDLVSNKLILVDYAKYVPACIKGIFGIKKPIKLRVSVLQVGLDSSIKTILRPMYDLTKEITHKDYNEDKPFIPSMKLAKIWGSRNDYTPTHVFSESLYVRCSPNKNGKDFYYCAALENMSQEELDLLNLLHFDTRGLIEIGEAISVHDLPKNPYEV